MRILADIATALRLGIVAFILYAGVQYGQEAFGAVAAVFLLGWILDTLDGHLARAAVNAEPSWLGRNERLIDAVMVVAIWLYLTLIGIVSAWICAAYLAIAVLLLARFRSIAILTVLEAPIVLLLLVVAFVLAPLWGWLYVICGVVGGILDRRRLRVRITILWEDVRHLRGSIDHEVAELSLQDRGEDRI